MKNIITGGSAATTDPAETKFQLVVHCPLKTSRPTVIGLTGGAVAGLVAITPASGYVYPMGALIIGLVSGVACWFFSTVVKKALGYDDSYDVFGIHGVGGIVGALLTGLVCVPVLAEVEPGMKQLGIQFYGILLTIGWCAIATFIILKAIYNLGYKALVMFFTGTVGIIIGGPISIMILSVFFPELFNESR